jgi:transposase
MATTSYLYHTQGLRGYKHIRTEHVDGGVRFHIRRDPHRRECRGCGARWPALRMGGQFIRTFVALPIGSRRQEVVLHGHEQTCTRCIRTLREPIPFAKGKQRYLNVVAVYIVALCRMAPIKHVAGFLGLSWDLVKAVFKEHLARRLKRRSLRKVRVIAIDEFAINKGQHYMTVVLDLETGQILWAAQGRDAGALIPFFRRLQQTRAHLEAVALDMWPAYLLAVRTVFPQVAVVHDPFHIVALVNRAIDETRRELYHTLSTPDRKVIKGSRFLLLRAGETLDDPARSRLEELMALNEPLYQAYLLKEDLRQLWHQSNIDTAAVFLSSWIERATATGLPHFRKLSATLKNHALQVLSWFHYPISTGPLEGLNNKIKVLKRQAYGFRDLDYFRLRLYFIHEATPAFPG